MTAGELSARIQIERDTITYPSGAELRTPAVVHALWAKPEALTGRESFRGAQVVADADWRFTVRYEWRGKILTSDRVIHRGVRMEIKAIVPDDLNRDSVVLLCRSLNQ